MIEIEIENDLNEKIQAFFGREGGKVNKLLEKALRKTTAYINKNVKKEIKANYEVFPGLVSPGMKMLTKNRESTLLASTKRKDISDFYVSNMSPARSKSKLLAKVRKKNGTTEMKTMFWAFYKNNTSKLGLFIRNRERNHIARVKSASSFQMANNAISEDVIKGANEIFNKSLEEAFRKELDNV